jgi:hypothetical protein
MEELNEKSEVLLKSLVDGFKDSDCVIKDVDVINDKFEFCIRRIDDTWINLNIRKQRTNSGVFATLTGKLRIVVSGLGNKKINYPETKNGFDISRIVSRVIDIIEKKKVEQERNKKLMYEREEASDFRLRLLEDNGLDNLKYSSKVKPVDNKTVSVSIVADEEKFKELVKQGYIKS